MTDLNELILQYVNRPGYAALRPKGLAKKLGVKKQRLAEFGEALERLHAAGALRLAASGRVQPKVPEGLVAGVIKKTSSGAGYLIPHEPRPSGFTGDVYLAPEDMQDAHNADEVLVRLLGKRRTNGQRCGVVVEIVERATNVFVGTYFDEERQGFVQIDGTGFAAAVWVGDPGAKGAQPGDKVVIEMVRFPTQHQQGEAVLTKVLGPRGTPGVDTLMVINEFGLRDEFPEDVDAEARIEAENFDEEDLDGREDLTRETIVTIDPADARDFDDAISLSREERGHWLLGVHIADVAHFVQPGTALDREAQQRGNSVYLPTRVLPMLPEVISNGLASLQERRVRYTKSAFIEFTSEGIPVSTRFANTAIKATKRFAYEQVLPVIRDPERHKHVPAPVRKLLCDMHELAMLLRRRRFQKGAYDLELPEIKLDFDKDGRVTGAHEVGHDESHQIIEEFMLAANIAVATELADRGITFLRRAHGDPSETKVRAFAEFAAGLGYPLRNPQSRKELQALLKRVRGEPTERAVHYALLRSMKQAEYTPLVLGHYALAEDSYCHFTSPIRRYPDLTVHRWLDALLTGNRTYRGSAGEELLRLGKHCSTTERRAAEAERELVSMKLLAYLETRIGMEMDAIVTGVERFGLFCRGVELPAEGLVHISTLSAGDYYDYDRAGMCLVSRQKGEKFRLGDPVRVSVVRVDVDRRELDLRLVLHARREGGRARRGDEPARAPRRRREQGGSVRKGGKRRRRS
jgi:ribonuclease R